MESFILCGTWTELKRKGGSDTAAGQGGTCRISISASCSGNKVLLTRQCPSTKFGSGTAQGRSVFSMMMEAHRISIIDFRITILALARPIKANN